MEQVLSKDQTDQLSAVDVAYDFIDEAGDSWTTDELLDVMARAGFPMNDGVELDGILEAVRERLEYEEILAEATATFLRQNRFRDLHQAAEMMDCTVEEVIDFIAAKARLFGNPH